MNPRWHLSRAAAATLVFIVATLFSTSASAQDKDANANTREAAKHFQRAVSLYGEADYRAAVVEFKRAYSLAPNTAVLYNIGETEYQLQDYAGALTTFHRYLLETHPTDAHRTEVERNVEVLRTRVGRLRITTLPAAGAEIMVDDQSVGKTPLEDAVLVSIGHRKVVASMPGLAPVIRYVDVAAEDDVAVNLPAAGSTEVGAGAGVQGEQPALRISHPSRSGSSLRIVGWVATGAFAAGALTFGLLADMAATDLKNARNAFPTTAATLSHDAQLTTTYSVIADSLTAGAILVGGITLLSMLLPPPSAPRASGHTHETRVMLGLGSARFETTF
ncbi:MAG: PEGA domain-containing protein [Myxococcota bacterium]|nr:PEGA domain-containing protein [Myxococcota bacterium]